MAKRTWRGGMVGAGAWSNTQLTAWADVSNAKIVAIADRHPDRRAPIAERFGISQQFDDVVPMLRSGRLDFVDVCTRPYSHAMLVRLAAAHGLPVLCQKPFCTSLDEARAVVGDCSGAGVRLMVNENFRWQAWYQKAHDVLTSGLIGTPFLAVMHQRNRLSLPRFTHYQTYFKDMEKALIYEVGTHQLDVMRFLFGEPESVYARTHRISSEFKGEDVETIVLGYSNLTCLIHDSWASVVIPDLYRPEQRKWYPRLLEIDGTAGTLQVRADGSVHLYTDDRHESWTTPVDATHRSHAAAQQHFVDCLESGAAFATSGEDTIKTLVLVYACYRSAAEGRVVRPAEMLA
jgi:predicted dehydrogenase